MVRSHLIDANSAIYALSGQFPGMRARFEACEPGDIAISSISFAEIALGSRHGNPPPAHSLDAFVALVPIIPFDEAAARAYAALPFKRARFDRLLAAHALSIGATVVTNNEADFADVPGLKVENWTV
ncbi:MAG: type II toxin-antitoxin system VapC family toxin [Croceibacterium sp.]